MIIHSKKTNAITGNVNLLKHLEAGFNLLVKVCLVTHLQRCSEVDSTEQPTGHC